MRLYISRKLRNIVPREEAWKVVRHIKEVHDLYAEAIPKSKKVKFERVSLLPIPWFVKLKPEAAVTILAMKRDDGLFDPVIFYCISKDEFPISAGRSLYSRHFYSVYEASEDTWKYFFPGDPVKFIPSHIRKHLRVSKQKSLVADE